MDVKTILYAVLLASILYPMADAGIRWLHSWIVFKMEIAGMTASAERCKSLNAVSGLCDWGGDCLCWAEHMHKNEAAYEASRNKTGHAEVYPSPRPANDFVPLTNMGQVIGIPKVGVTPVTQEIEGDEPAYADLAFVWPEKVNPGLVEEGTQPVEAEEDPFPGFSNLGG